MVLGSEVEAEVVLEEEGLRPVKVSQSVIFGLGGRGGGGTEDGREVKA